jgi:branched-chain amino acid transport system substrate-binding protein
MAIAEVAEQTGARTAAVAFLDDTYGRPLAEATIAALEGRQLTVATRVPFNAGDEDLQAHAIELAEADVGVVVIIGDADEGTRLLSALGEVAAAQPEEAVTDVILNGAMRTPSSPALVQGLPTAMRELVRGVSPVASPTTPEEPPGLFATNAVDCVNLIALASAQAGSDNPAEMAEQIEEVSSTGVACADFASCVGLLDDNRNIDYEGLRGGVEIGTGGDPRQARFEVFSFDANGVDQPLRTFSISS